MVVPSIKGIEFWDFTDINNIQQVKKLALPTVNGGDYTNVAWQLWWQAPYLYVASANHGVYIVDVSDPKNPKLAVRPDGKPNPISSTQLGGFRTGVVFAVGNLLVTTSTDQAGLHGLLLPLRGQAEGFSTAALGLMGTAWAAASSP